MNSIGIVVLLFAMNLYIHLSSSDFFENGHKIACPRNRPISIPEYIPDINPIQLTLYKCYCPNGFIECNKTTSAQLNTKDYSKVTLNVSRKAVNNRLMDLVALQKNHTFSNSAIKNGTNKTRYNENIKIALGALRKTDKLSNSRDPTSNKIADNERMGVVDQFIGNSNLLSGPLDNDRYELIINIEPKVINVKKLL